jgi:amino-acid N-acetyltransferase
MNLSPNIFRSDLRTATAADRDSITELLKTVDLPTSELDAHLTNFLVAYCGNRLAGCAGMERYGKTALLRSLAVHPDYQGLGLGRKLAEAILAEAKRTGASDVVLLTHTATDLARSLGFVETTREALPPVVLESWEFRSDCCCKAHCMRLSFRS